MPAAGERPRRPASLLHPPYSWYDLEGGEQVRDRVRFLEADATRVPLPDGTSTACISQEAFVHIEDKSALSQNASAFSVLAECSPLPTGPQQHACPKASGALRSDFAADGLVTENDYRQALERAGFSNLSCEDLSPDWARMLRERLAMYRSLREETVARFGEEHDERYDRSYAFFVDLVEAGKLGGARLTALRP
jgi:sarcosine/dimethylglycine N-methyltransferase